MIVLNKKTIQSWLLYDWASSAFATSTMAAIMPIFFSQVAAINLKPYIATAYFGYIQSISLIIIVFLSPILGAVADSFKTKKSS